MNNLVSSAIKVKKLLFCRIFFKQQNKTTSLRMQKLRCKELHTTHTIRSWRHGNQYHMVARFSNGFTSHVPSISTLNER